MSTSSITAVASPNIAFIKYWGNQDERLRLPANGSISMNLAGLQTRTTVRFDDSLAADGLTLNGAQVSGQRLARVSTFLDLVRELAGMEAHADVASENNFPAGAGVASSASAFAALALAASKAAGLDLGEAELSRLARRGSGSACRSVPDGFVEWQSGRSDADSYAASIAIAEHWALTDCIAVVSTDHKSIGSNEGHALAATSPLQAARLADAPRRLGICRQAILERDFDALAEISELDSNLMHAVMLTSSPPLQYWLETSLTIMRQVPIWRQSGLPVCYSVDAGPNVHVLCLKEAARIVADRLRQMAGVLDVLSADVGVGARLI